MDTNSASRPGLLQPGRTITRNSCSPGWIWRIHADCSCTGKCYVYGMIGEIQRLTFALKLMFIIDLHRSYPSASITNHQHFLVPWILVTQLGDDTLLRCNQRQLFFFCSTGYLAGELVLFVSAKEFDFSIVWCMMVIICNYLCDPGMMQLILHDSVLENSWETTSIPQSLEMIGLPAKTVPLHPAPTAHAAAKQTNSVSSVACCLKIWVLEVGWWEKQCHNLRVTLG